MFWNATTIFWQKMSFYLFIAISFYRNIAILCAKMSCVTRGLRGTDFAGPVVLIASRICKWKEILITASSVSLKDDLSKKIISLQW
jgi:hypothetical protein